MNVPWAVWVRESMTTDLVLDALEMGIWQRQRGRHSIRGARSSFRRWFPIHLDPLLRTARRGRRATLDWVGRGLLRQRDGRVDHRFVQTELIRRQGPWCSLDAVELATMEWVDWYNNRRLFEAIGDIPPAEAEANHYRTTTPSAILQMVETSLH